MPDSLIFAGSFSHEPDVDAMLYFSIAACCGMVGLEWEETRNTCTQQAGCHNVGGGGGFRPDTGKTYIQWVDTAKGLATVIIRLLQDGLLYEQIRRVAWEYLRVYYWLMSWKSTLGWT